MSLEFPCIYFEKDGVCRKFSDDTAISYCVMGPCPEKKLSNADRIRAMSDQELAEYLCGLTYCCECEHRNACNGEDGYLKWLQQPAKEGT